MRGSSCAVSSPSASSPSRPRRGGPARRRPAAPPRDRPGRRRADHPGAPAQLPRPGQHGPARLARPHDERRRAAPVVSALARPMAASSSASARAGCRIRSSTDRSSAAAARSTRSISTGRSTCASRSGFAGPERLHCRSDGSRPGPARTGHVRRDAPHDPAASSRTIASPISPVPTAFAPGAGDVLRARAGREHVARSPARGRSASSSRPNE